ncbi:RTA1-like protein [Favolaschia claudopus]|uniref:RTA1-like protein n=1 Tax=Favolaschia claudopus TaxID=2862362 RepID=A0AAW0BFF9_9AGAR
MSSFNETITPAVPDSAYGYIPTRSIAFLFLTLFGISTAAHAAQAVYYRMWWLLATAFLCGVGEIVGWSGRLWSSYSPRAGDPYLMQVTSTIIAPTPLIAVNFILLGRIVSRLGPCYSRLSPKLYTRIFLTCDIIALIVQGGGGGIAASSHKRETVDLGGNIMLGGIIFQFIALIFYSALAADFLRNYANRNPVRTSSERGVKVMDTRLKLLVQALCFSTLVLFVRSIYRMVELADGWTGKIITTEVYFNIFDAGMVTLAIYTINVAHPGMLLGSNDVRKENMLMKQIPSSSQDSLV